MKAGSTHLFCLLLVITCLATSSCATKKFYNGVEATDLSGLIYGISRTDVKTITGNPKREFQCESGSSIVTYVYDQGYTGCVGEGRCKAEDEKYLQATEIGMVYFTAGLFSWALNNCITPCQEGILELSYDSEDRLIGVRELPPYREGYCWDIGGWNKPHEGCPCSRIYANSRSSSVPEQLILDKDPEDTCEKYKEYNESKLDYGYALKSQLQYLSHAQHPLSRGDYEAAYRLLEDGLVSGNKVVRERFRQFMKQHPEILIGAKASFTTESFKKSKGKDCVSASRREYRRLLIYKTVALAHDYQEAKRNYLIIFGSPD